MTTSMIAGTGVGIPKNKLTNHDLEKIVDTSDEWIRTRTGIENRFIADKNQNTSDLATMAAKQAMKAADVSAKEIDRIIIATITGDIGFPSTAVLTQKNLGAVNAAAFDIAATCSGFLYGLELGDSLIGMKKAENVLVIGAETLSKITDYEDRNTCVLFGDGAGAVVLRPSDGKRGILGTFTKSDGRLNKLLIMEGLGTKYPPSYENVDKKLHYISMQGREVFKHAVTCMGDAAEHILKQTGLTSNQVDLLISHQANKRIIDATAKRINLPPERVFTNVHKYGNTSAASIPISIHEALQEGRLQQGSLAVLAAFGGGFTWASCAVRI